MRDGNLTGLRVLDLAGEPAILAGRLLGDLGADVIALEPPGGHPLRRRGPFLGDTAEPERSLAWIAAGTSRRSVICDVETEEGGALFLELCATADALIDTSRPGRLERLGLDDEALATRFPHLIVCTVTPFGATGPRRDWRASDLTALAASGNLYSTGDPERAPVRCSLPTAYFHAGLEAAIAVLFALLARRATGRGQRVDVSLQEVMLMPNISQSAQFPLTGFRGARAGSGYRAGKTFQPEIWRSADGWVSFALRGGAARIPGLVALVDWMREDGRSAICLERRDWKSYNHNLLTQAEVDEMTASFGAFFATKTMAELYQAALARRLMLAPINDPAAILASAQLAARDFFVALEEPHLGATIRHPGKLARTLPDGIPGPFRAPRLGEHDAEVRREITERNRAPVAPRSAPGGTIFAGLRVVEFGGGAAGPVATRYLADHGAMVIRVESRERPDFLRTLTLRPDTPGGLDASLHFAILNANKLSVAINMNVPEGVAIARRLALAADVVAENFSPKAMAKWGLDWESLAPDRSDLVMVSTCLYGQTGPERMYAGFGGQGSAIAGFNHLTGWPDLPPNGPFGTITDSLSPRLAAALVAAALWRRAETGSGQYIDLSQVETGVYCLAEAIVARDATAVTLERMGNRSREAVPHGVFPAADDGGKGDRWVAIVCEGDDDWRRLRAALGEPDWSRDERFATAAGRRAAEDELEARLAEWTRERRAGEIAERLQAAGVDTAAVADFEDLHTDPQLAHRGHFRSLEHAVIGRHAVETDAMRFSVTPERIERAAPRLGEHTEQVLHEMLGMSVAEIRELEEKGVIR